MSIVSTQPACSGRGQELGLLIFALIAVLGAWILAYYGVHNSQPPQLLPDNFTLIAGGGAGTLLLCHLLIRRFAPYADPILFPASIMLTGLGLAMIYRIDFQLVARGDNPDARGQMLLAFVGLIFMMTTIGFLRDHRWLRRITYISLIVGLLLLLLPLVPGLR